MLKDDRAMPILTGVILIVSAVALGQRADDILAYLTTERPPQIAPVDDAAQVAPGGSVLVDVLANDAHATAEDAARLRIVSSPACGAAEIASGGIFYIANPRCSGPQSVVYCVARGDECPAATIMIDIAVRPAQGR